MKTMLWSLFFFFSSRRRHTRCSRDWSSDVCSSDLIQALYATGRFADIQVEAERTPDRQVAVVFLTTPNYFIGEITVDGAPAHPTDTQIINAGKLQLGELFTREKMDRALLRIRGLMEENGYY